MPGSSCSRNHRRCWENDVGLRSPATPAGIGNAEASSPCSRSLPRKTRRCAAPRLRKRVARAISLACEVGFCCDISCFPPARSSTRPGHRAGRVVLAGFRSVPPGRRRWWPRRPGPAAGSRRAVRGSATAAASPAGSARRVRRSCRGGRPASRECPPSSKKLSWRPTRSTFSSACQSPASASSRSPHGASKARSCQPGTGSALRSSLPLALRGRRSSSITWAGTMNAGSSRPRAVFSASADGCRPASATT
ncbi:hypothetical protein D3C78_857990 [compost metagenome]